MKLEDHDGNDITEPAMRGLCGAFAQLLLQEAQRKIQREADEMRSLLCPDGPAPETRQGGAPAGTGPSLCEALRHAYDALDDALDDVAPDQHEQFWWHVMRHAQDHL